MRRSVGLHIFPINLEQAEGRVRKLEFDNAELQRWANDVCLKKLQELSDELSSKYNQKKHRNKNWKTELGRSREEINLKAMPYADTS